MDHKNLALVAGVAVTSFIAGGLVTKYLAGNKNEKHNKLHLNSNLVDQYIIEHSLREHHILTELREHTLAKVSMSVMLSDVMQVQFIQSLLKSLNAKRCIEVGTYTGYNALSCALTLPEDGVVYALDISHEYLSHGVPFFEKAKVSHKIHQMIAPAADSMDKLIAEGKTNTFDFVYIDADKLAYGGYYEQALILLRTGGYVVLDNMFWDNAVLDPNNVEDEEDKEIANYFRKLQLEIKADERVDVSFLKFGDGALFCRKR